MYILTILTFKFQRRNSYNLTNDRKVVRSYFIKIHWLSIWELNKTNRKSLNCCSNFLSLAAQLQCVATDPGSATGASLGLRVAVTLAKTAWAATGGCQTTHFAMLVHRVYYPVDLGIPADGLKKKQYISIVA